MIIQDLTPILHSLHYPPYTSKYNPLEHRLFPHLTRACQGVVFSRVTLDQDLMAKATTHTGLEVSVNICNKAYATGRKVAANFKEQMRVIFDEELCMRGNIIAIEEKLVYIQT